MKKAQELNYTRCQYIFHGYRLAVKEKLLVSLENSLDEAVKSTDFKNLDWSKDLLNILYDEM